MINKISVILFFFFSIVGTAQNDINITPEHKTIDSLKLELKKIINKINSRDKATPKDFTSIRDGKTAAITYRTNLSNECGLFVNQVIQKHGWLSIPKVGKTANKNFGFLINFAHDSIKTKYKSIIKTSVLKGESDPFDYATLIDGLLVYNGKLQVYGTILGPDPYSDEFKMRVYDISEPEYVNQRRQDINLNPIEDYLKKYDVEWDIPQKKK